MTCYPSQPVPTEYHQRQRDERAEGLRRLSDTSAPELAAEVASEAYFEFRRGVFRAPGMQKAFVFNNNPAHFREAEWNALKTLLTASGYAVETEGQYPPDGAESAGYTRAMLIAHASGEVNTHVIETLMADALRSIGQRKQLFHEIRIED